MAGVTVFYRHVVGAYVMVPAENLSREEHDEEEQKAENRQGGVDEHAGLTLHPAILDCQRSARIVSARIVRLERGWL